MFNSLGFGEVGIILGLAVLLFGPSRLPEAARGLGRSLKAFKEGMKEAASEVKSDEKHD